eukprot:CAMPEP_0119548442 /NCGR_PEP_ID=MMETSP1352-20130426/2372_1 /TAXON_ID=265584 /ORGANISM="Stauroneis constricta, Strain CCMP1120" /LENGTH=1054 /DNA_ID=CAMNT_0007593725 /DNA_START=73 /DNA_END=3237 /DNA_ORIENTATION=+
MSEADPTDTTTTTMKEEGEITTANASTVTQPKQEETTMDDTTQPSSSSSDAPKPTTKKEDENEPNQPAATDDGPAATPTADASVKQEEMNADDTTPPTENSADNGDKPEEGEILADNNTANTATMDTADAAVKAETDTTTAQPKSASKDEEEKEADAPVKKEAETPDAKKESSVSESEDKTSAVESEDSDSKPKSAEGAQPDETIKENDQDRDTEKDSDKEAETASNSGGGKTDLHYSTRGRSTNAPAGPFGAGQDGGKPDGRGARDAAEEKAKAKESNAAASGVSFLESLTEEERRTRTRFLPDVGGMHALRKTEIKGDLLLARAILGEDGQHKPKHKRAKSSDDDVVVVAATAAAAPAVAAVVASDAMEVDEGESPSPSETDSDIARPGVQTIEFGPRDLVVPSKTFVPPPLLVDGVNMEDLIDGNIEGMKEEDVIPPSVVEAVTAFNPPRPPESVGTKKKHRMLRWKRRPQDVDSDLRNYRKTVQRTCQELERSGLQRQRLQALNAHLRRHFLTHLNSLNDEFHLLTAEYSSVEQECMKAVNSSSSDTSIKEMADVIAALSKISPPKQTATADPGADSSDVANINSAPSPGFGGLAQGSFKDWDRKSSHASAPLVGAWVLPGQEVTTPFGDGKVIRLDGPRLRKDDKSSEPNQEDQQQQPAEGQEQDPSVVDGEEEHNVNWDVAPPRVAVALEHGTGYLPATSIKINAKEDPSSLSDDRLAQRWKALVETAQAIGPCLDIEGIQTAINGLDAMKQDTSTTKIVPSDVTSGGDVAVEKPSAEVAAPDTANSTAKTSIEPADAETPMAVDSGTVGGDAGAAAAPAEADTEKPQEEPKAPVDEKIALPDVAASSNDAAYDPISRIAKSKYVPYGAGLLPTASGRGAVLDKLPIKDIERAVEDALFDGEGVLGTKSNLGVTSEIREWEDHAEEYVVLQAEVSQQRNALMRQRRIRTLNERTYAATLERTTRIENLVNEMQADLKSLKSRLNDELKDLGLSESTATSILAQHYKRQYPGRLEEEVGADAAAAAGDAMIPDAKRQKTEGGDVDVMMT